MRNWPLVTETLGFCQLEDFFTCPCPNLDLAQGAKHRVLFSVSRERLCICLISQGILLYLAWG